MRKDAEIKFCVCAMVDLRGFSSHLEMSGYDLRTSIGEQAVMRLNNLEEIVERLREEERSRPEYYPELLQIQRINDAIFLTIDLNDILRPSIGNTDFQGFTTHDVLNFISIQQDESLEAFEQEGKSIIQIAVAPLMKFIGLIARIHMFINGKEAKSFFPGAKTVVSTGLRRPFKDDYFSANFALSNAYLAERSLHGSSLYIDNGILRLISFNKYARNLLQFGHFQFKKIFYDCFESKDHPFNTSTEDLSILQPTIVNLFRKEYQFRELNPSPLTYLQNIPLILEYLDEIKTPNLSKQPFTEIFYQIKSGILRDPNQIIKPTRSFLYNVINDLSHDIGVFKEFLDTGTSTNILFQESVPQTPSFRSEIANNLLE